MSQLQQYSISFLSFRLSHFVSHSILKNLLHNVTHAISDQMVSNLVAKSCSIGLHCNHIYNTLLILYINRPTILFVKFSIENPHPIQYCNNIAIHNYVEK